jgi:hypothetical protein
MPRKTYRNKGVKRDHSLRLTFLVLGSFLLVVALTVFFKVQSQAETFCANSISCVKDLSGKKEATNDGIFMGRTVTAPEIADDELYALKDSQNVLGDTTSDYKRIYVDLSRQHLYAYEGGNRVYDFPISSGKWNATPTGTFRIHVWLRYTRMSGGSQAHGTYYNLPNVPYTMYFGNSAIPWSRGFALHGAYWHNNFGQPMSHGCINMRSEDAGKIYTWTIPGKGNTAYETKENPGTLITIYGTAPTE